MNEENDEPLLGDPPMGFNEAINEMRETAINNLFETVQSGEIPKGIDK